jgi:hypothetical protein
MCQEDGLRFRFFPRAAQGGEAEAPRLRLDALAAHPSALGYRSRANARNDEPRAKFGAETLYEGKFSV